jgi:manganese transport protein
MPVLFWSVIAAAFIGPGTVTTCASAGARHGFALLWAVLFSTLACLVLQEAAARLAILSGLDLGRAIRARFHRGAAGLLALLLVLGAIVLGCAAYEAGNILGAVSGVALGAALPGAAMTLALGAGAGALLWFGRAGTVARLMGIVVAFMGAAFLIVALLLRPGPAALLRGALLPVLPAGAGLLVLGLVGTTVVPYNLFLGSALARGQNLSDVRLGLVVAIPLGGFISMGILVTGAAVSGPFSFESLAATLSGRLGWWAGPFFAFGLFTAGFSSAITAPLAAALTARSLFAGSRPERWDEHAWRYRAVWLAVLASGVVLALSGVRPIPAILLAQALNGVLLPFVSCFLLIMLNDRALLGDEGLNRPASNALMGAVVAVTLLLGVMNALGATADALGLEPRGPGAFLAASALAAALVAAPVARAVRRGRRSAGSLM